MKLPFRRVRHVHMIGIGGSGMSGIAEVLLNLGFRVSGSDLNATEVTSHLTACGADIEIGHREKNITGAHVVVYSSAVRPENVEMRAARDSHIPLISRAEMLAELMRMKFGIAVAGTHGKTTTTSMIGTILQEAGLDPTLIVGGIIRTLGSGARRGEGGVLIAEADEFDRSFLKLSPTLAVITTIEIEHLDTYLGLEEIQDAFVEFANRLPFYGAAIIRGDDPGIFPIISRIKRPIITYSIDGDTDYAATDVEYVENKCNYVLRQHGEDVTEVKLLAPGPHNLANSLAALAIAAELDIPLDTAAKALSSFTGVRRRFEIRGEPGGVLVVSDFAHHPTEISVTLETARRGWNRRLVVLFQPHLYTRTRDFAEEFGKTLAQADVVLIADIYPARERPLPGITGRLVAESTRSAGCKDVTFCPDNSAIDDALEKTLREGDLLIVMGAGDIWKVAEKICAEENA
ncbi:UDP-N-acetylmuramate--L-alanine ligase [bacterium]|nr:UDP-N-acetylmuramate--L-alanine ligase [bacterium]